MTTIACARGVMACDSAWSTDYEVFTRRPKIIRLSSGALLGEAGDDDSRDMWKLFDKVKTYKQMPSRKDLMDTRINYSALLLVPSGKIFSVDVSHDKDREGWMAGVFEVAEPFSACGSGTPYALAVMEYLHMKGKLDEHSARSAVQVACRRDLHSRTPVHVMRLLPAGNKEPTK